MKASFFARVALWLTALCLLVTAVSVTGCRSVNRGAEHTETEDGGVGDTHTETHKDTDTDVSTETDDDESTPTQDTDTAPSVDTESVTQAESDSETTSQDPETSPMPETVKPVASVEGGLYTEAVEVILTAPEGYRVRYTTNGTIPTNRSARYTEPITVAPSVGEGLTLRAACFDDNETLTGEVVTHTYVRVKKTQSQLYTVMISVKGSDLSDMIADYDEKIERPAHVEIVTPAGETVISQDAGLRLFGGSSRELAQKSFKLIARKDGYFGHDQPYVGRGTFRYPLFPQRVVKAGSQAGEVLDRYDSFILRNGGNDSLLHNHVNAGDSTLLRDGLINDFAFSYAPHVDVSLSNFAAVYINGAYYGLLELRENQNEDYVKRIYGVDDADVVVVKSELDTTRACDRHQNGGECRFCGSWFYYETDDNAAAQAEMKQWIGLCRQVMGAYKANDAMYQSVYDKLAQRLDLQNFMEYMALGLYFCNTDWPHNNVKLYRYTGEAVEGNPITDGKWRFMTRDMDMAMARYSSPEVLPELDSRADVNTFRWVLANYVDAYDDGRQYYGDALYIQGLFAFCMRNDQFRAEFVAYARTLAASSAETELARLYEDAYAQVYEGIVAHTNRWKDELPNGYGALTWRGAVSRIKEFIRTRPAFFLEDLDNLVKKYG